MGLEPGKKLRANCSLTIASSGEAGVSFSLKSRPAIMGIRSV